MKKFLIHIIYLVIIVTSPTMAIAGECYSDTVVKRWIDERDRAEERVLQLWAKGSSTEDFASHVAVILSNEFYICSKCRNNGEFLGQSIHVLKKGTSSLKVESVPAIILERMVGQELLSPWQQFPAKKGKGVAKGW